LISSGRKSARALGVPLERVPGAGHLAMLGNPARVAELVCASIERSLLMERKMLRREAREV
jgi:pimeloyl-ACP methyl ester carboxylesterase